VIKAGDSVEVTAKVKLGTLKPEDVLVEVFTGPISLKNDVIERAERFEMNVDKEDHGIYIYKATITTTKTGQLGYSARILPKHKDLVHNFLPGLIKWA
jgi:starch phosphorylase